MAETFQEKTEQPTERRIEESRKKGQIAQSREIPSSLIILFSSIFMYFTVSKGFSEIFRLYVSYIKNLEIEVDLFHIKPILLHGLYGWIKITFPVFLLLLIISIFGHVIQRGFLFSFDIITPNFEHINPVQGIKRLFTKRSLAELFKSILKVTIIVYVAYTFIMKELPILFSLPQKETSFIIAYLGRGVFKLSLHIGIVFLFLALFDFLFQKWQHIKDLMMTKEELKEEMKEREGNPLVKARIRSIQRELARRRMIEDVKTADVVVTNPDSFAIALKYIAHEMPAPQVVARGAGFIAQKIKKVAQEAHVPLVEHRLLARALFYSVRVGEYIPEKFYMVVAEVLARVYRSKRGIAV